MTAAEIVYKAAIALILCVVLGAIAVDFALWIADRPTITQYLRANPRQLVIPSLILLEALLALVLHLFWRVA